MPSPSAYMRRYRRENPDATRVNGARQRARNAAARTVARRYPNLFEAEYVAECETRGIDPYPRAGRPPAWRNAQ